jgi:hypothetical protein
MTHEYNENTPVNDVPMRVYGNSRSDRLTPGIRLLSIKYGLSSLVWVAIVGMLFAGVILLRARYPEGTLIRTPHMIFHMLLLLSIMYILLAMYMHGIRQVCMLFDHFKVHFAQVATLPYRDRLILIVSTQLVFMVGTLYIFSQIMQSVELIVFICLSMGAIVVSVFNINHRREFMRGYCLQNNQTLQGGYA